jgi:acetyl esterase
VAHGRLSNPDCTLGTDPRSDPRMVEAFAQFGLDNNAPVLPFTIDSPLEERRAFATMVEEGMDAVLSAFGQGGPDVEGVTTTTTTITGEDGNEITLYISRPDTVGPLPALVHLHGGGMAIASAADVGYQRLRERLARTVSSSSVLSFAIPAGSSVRTHFRPD